MPRGRRRSLRTTQAHSPQHSKGRRKTPARPFPAASSVQSRARIAPAAASPTESSVTVQWRYPAMTSRLRSRGGSDGRRRRFRGGGSDARLTYQYVHAKTTRRSRNIPLTALMSLCTGARRSRSSICTSRTCLMLTLPSRRLYPRHGARNSGACRHCHKVRCVTPVTSSLTLSPAHLNATNAARTIRQP